MLVTHPHRRTANLHHEMALSLFDQTVECKDLS